MASVLTSIGLSKGCKDDGADILRCRLSGFDIMGECSIPSLLPKSTFLPIAGLPTVGLPRAGLPNTDTVRLRRRCLATPGVDAVL